jgi:hypothetical protein
MVVLPISVFSLPTARNGSDEGYFLADGNFTNSAFTDSTIPAARNGSFADEGYFF